MNFIRDELKRLEDEGLLRTLRALETGQGVRVRIGGRDYLSFCSNDYLGLASHPKLFTTVRDTMRKFGWGAGAARLVSGTMTPHAELERALAEFEGTAAAVVFPTGYMANVGTIPALVGEGDLVIGDRLNHGSLIDGCRLSRSTFRFYEHCDMDSLRKRLARRPDYRRALVVTDSVFSMDGDLAPLPEIVQIAREHDAVVMVDEAHATGVFGERGRGVAERLGVKDEIDVRMGTLSKAVGSIGGFVCGTGALVSFLQNCARTFMLTTSLPPAACAASTAGLKRISESPHLRERLWQNVEHVRKVLDDLGLDTGNSASQIFPIIIGDAARATAVSSALDERGILIPAIRPPTVPKGTSRLRLTVSAAHSAEDIERLVEALAEVKVACGL
ncbi:MAG: 8-amino-7-oxononanoate synthase [Planctomycetes bacterium]|nr:8-amino-7-oxononanoate synthase [Planctomycetota bacterium]